MKRASPWRSPFLWAIGVITTISFVNYASFFKSMPSSPSMRYVHNQFAAPWLMDRLDESFCNAKDKLLESSETSSMSQGKASRQFILKNLRVMSDPLHVEDAVLIMVVYNNQESWGKGRTVRDFIKLVKTFDYPMHKTSLGILTSSEAEYDLLKTLFQQELLSSTSFAQVSISLRQDFSINLSRGDRKADNVQKERRRMLARYRNYALSQSLASWHSHVVWIDSDIVEIPTYLVTKMVKADKDILEPLCHLKGMNEFDYDLNAWYGNRKVPTPEEIHAMHHEGKDFVGGPQPGTLHMNDMRNDEYHELDSVGGTMLYVKADIHRQGVLFTTHYVIGSEWKFEGYDGIETEGLCYIAQMLGYKCFAMPKDIIYHAPNE